MQELKNNILKVDVSDGKLNYSQRNNNYTHTSKKGLIDVKSSTMCNVTSLCMALDYNGFVFPTGPYEQPEDNLAKFIMESKEVDDYYRIHCPALYKDYVAERGNYYTPNEVHCVLAFAVNQWLGCSADTFKENTPIFDIITELLEGRSCVISGVFNGLHHIVTLVGAEWTFNVDTSKKTIYRVIEEVQKNRILPTKFIIDDPYGKWNAPNGYKSGMSGNNAELTTSEFMKMIKPVGNNAIKYCHLIKSGASLV